MPQTDRYKSLSTLFVMAQLLFFASLTVAPTIAAPPVTTKVSKWPLYDQGVGAYQSKRYNEASSYFGESIKRSEPGTAPLCLLYQGHCALAMGNRNLAKSFYTQLITLYKNSREAQIASQSLAKIDPGASLKAVANDSTATDNSLPDASDEGSPSVALLKSRIEVARPVVGHPEVSLSLQSSMEDWLRELPKPIRKSLNKNKIKIILTPTLIDKLPALGYREGRGYDGASYKSCPGMFWGDTIYICERTVDEGNDTVSQVRRPEDLKGTFLHECGHALDACHERFSEKEEFRHNYYLDIAHVPDHVASKIKYYLQKSVAGQQECCAELTGILLGNRRDHYQEMRESFPNTIKVIQKQLNLAAPTD